MKYPKPQLFQPTEAEINEAAKRLVKESMAGRPIEKLSVTPSIHFIVEADLLCDKIIAQLEKIEMPEHGITSYENLILAVLRKQLAQLTK